MDRHEENRRLLLEHARLKSELGPNAPQTIKARNQVVEANIGLGFSLFSRQFRGQVEPGEVKGLTALGLMRALKDFDVSRGLMFSTYAAHWLRHTFQRYVDNQSKTVRIPCHALRRRYEPSNAWGRFALRNAHTRALRLDGPAWGGDYGDAQPALGEVLPAPVGEHDDRLPELERALASLHPFERLVVTRAQEESFLGLAEGLHVKRDTVALVYRKGLGKLQAALATGRAQDALTGLNRGFARVALQDLFPHGQ